MPAVENILDMANTTLNNLGRFKLTDLSYTLQEHVAVNELMKKSRVTEGDGIGFEFTIVTDDNGSARNVQLYEQDVVNKTDVTTKGYVPWRHTTANFPIEEREIVMNGGASRIYDFAKLQRQTMMMSYIKLMEANAWNKPVDSTNLTSPFGIPYWIVKGTSADVSLQGGNPVGFTAGCAGVSSSDVSQWDNWAFIYADVSKTDLIRKMREAYIMSDFRPPVPHPSYAMGASRHGFYTNYRVLGPITEAIEAQNQSLGNDIASKDGMERFKGVPIKYVPYLQADTSDPIYGIDWSVFQTKVLRGWFMKESGQIRSANQHNVLARHIDTSYNFFCPDRRKCFVGSKAA